MNFPDFFDALDKNNCIMEKFENIFNAHNKDIDKVKDAIAKDASLKNFCNSDNLLIFIMENIDNPKGMSEPDQIKYLLQILSKTGGNVA